MGAQKSEEIFLIYFRQVVRQVVLILVLISFLLSCTRDRSYEIILASFNQPLFSLQMSLLMNTHDLLAFRGGSVLLPSLDSVRKADTLDLNLLPGCFFGLGAETCDSLPHFYSECSVLKITVKQ